MLVGIEGQAHGGDSGDAMLAEHLVQLPPCRLDAIHQPLELLVLAQFFGDCLDGAGEVVGDAEHVAGETGGGIGARVGHVFFHPAADILRFRLGVENFLLRRLEVVAQRGQRRVLVFAARVFGAAVHVAIVQELLRDAFQFLRLLRVRRRAFGFRFVRHVS